MPVELTDRFLDQFGGAFDERLVDDRFCLGTWHSAARENIKETLRSSELVYLLGRYDDFALRAEALRMKFGAGGRTEEADGNLKTLGLRNLRDDVLLTY